jgi:hypothetical protein
MLIKMLKLMAIMKFTNPGVISCQIKNTVFIWVIVQAAMAQYWKQKNIIGSPTAVIFAVRHVIQHKTYRKEKP